MIKIYENRHQSNNHQPLHSHQNFQLLYILEGQGQMLLEKEKFAIAKGDLLYLRPKSMHGLHSNQKMVVICLDFEGESLSKISQKLLKDPLLTKSIYLAQAKILSSKIIILLKEMLAYQTKQNNYVAEKHQINLANILLELIDILKTPDFEDADQLRAYQLKNYIDSYYYEIPHLSVLEERFSLSVRRLGEIFKNHYQITLNNYLNQVRVERSQVLLLETQNDITTICFEVGFSSFATFYRQFKKHTKKTPKQFRDSVSENEKYFQK